jgi:hypothetical protein
VGKCVTVFWSILINILEEEKPQVKIEVTDLKAQPATGLERVDIIGSATSTLDSATVESSDGSIVVV